MVAQLAEGEPRFDLLSDERTILIVAFEGAAPIGFVLAHELARRHGERSSLFVYELQVAAPQRRRGVARRLLQELRTLAQERGIARGFVLTNAANVAAMRLYESCGGRRPSDDDVLWDFDYRTG